MKNLNELLRDSDPLQHEPTWPSAQRDISRQAVLAATSGARASVGSRSRIAVFVTAALMVIATSLLGALVWSQFINDLQAAIRFEVRLAEVGPAPGLRAVKIPGSGRSLYLHDEVIVTNSDIAAARVIQVGGPSEYGISVEFNAAGAAKMRAATANHIGKLMAILLDGQVVMAPVIRTPIGAAAEITGSFTRTQAERIVRGIEIK